ncbi:MAG TPA: hypothetical protein VJO14_05960 [Bacteroidota bacterium]|nr:hypothetical protein [Bacteroidota bacterium]
MADWPDIPAADFGTEEKLYKPQVRTPFDGNYSQSRPATTRGIRIFPLSWSTMSEADFQTLEIFFLANQGSNFNWTHPLSSVVYSCRFIQDTLDSVWVAPGQRSVKCPIEVV